MRWIGMFLIVLGLVGIFYGGISYTKKEKVLDLGDVEATVDKQKRVRFPPIAGGLMVVAGALLVYVDRRAIRTA